MNGKTRNQSGVDIAALLDGLSREVFETGLKSGLYLQRKEGERRNTRRREGL